MKWNFETSAQRYARMCSWHKYFAWTPVIITGTDRKVWLETIYRKNRPIRSDYNVIIGNRWLYAEDVFEVLKDN
jgi:hypothetical protein